MRRHRAALRLVLLVPAALLAFAACGGSEAINAGGRPPAAGNPKGSVTGPSGGTDPGDGLGSGDPQIVSPRKGLAQIHPIHWEKVDVADDNRKLRVQFYDGIEECYGLADVKVEYRKEAVVVSLFGGTVPNAGVCIEIAVLKATIIELEEPVAGRTIEDGAPQ